MVETLKIMATPFKGPMQAPQLSVPTSLAAGPRRPRLCQRLLHTHRRVWVSLLWGHCSFLLGHGAHKVVFVPSKSQFPLSCASFGGSQVGLMVTSSKRAYAIPKSAAPRALPLQQFTDDLFLRGRHSNTVCLSLCGVSGSWCTQGECTGHSKHPLPTAQEKTLHMDITRWSALKSD